MTAGTVGCRLDTVWLQYRVLIIIYYFIVKRIVCNETFEKLLEKHLQSNGMKLERIKEEDLDDAFEGAEYDYTEAEVDCSANAIHDFPPVLRHIGLLYECRNNEDTPIEEKYNKDIEYMEGLEHIKTKCSEWSICGGLSAMYQGSGASTVIGYTRRQSEQAKKIESTTQTQHITKTISIPLKHYRSVVQTQRFQVEECTVKNVKLIFPKNAKITCEVHDSSKVKRKDIFIRAVLKDCIKDNKADRLTAILDGKYVWVETSVYLDVSDPKPIIDDK